MISYLTSTKEEKSTEEQELKLAGSRSPTAIAPIINVLEHEFSEELELNNRERERLLEAIKVCSVQSEKLVLEEQLAGLDQKIDSSLKFETAKYDFHLYTRKLDALIGKKKVEQLKEMEKEASRFRRTTLSFQSSADFPELPPSVRSMKPFKRYSDLQALAETYSFLF